MKKSYFYLFANEYIVARLLIVPKKKLIFFLNFDKDVLGNFFKYIYLLLQEKVIF